MKPNLNKPVYPFLLVIFFFLHALRENYNPALIKTALWLILVYSIVALLFILGFILLLKDRKKAALLVFSIMAFNFFFGSFYDLLKRNFHDSFITKLSFILAVALIFLAGLFIYLKRTKRKLLRVTQYLNLLFIVLILLDTASMLFMKKKVHIAGLSQSLRSCDTCPRPDIYLIIVDEYAGYAALQDLFSFDNTSFENQLKERGFHIVNNSTSNYNATVYSMASMLNMDYIDNLHKPSLVNHRDMLLCRSLIKKNNLTDFLQKNNYFVSNYSFFDMAHEKKAVSNLFYSSNKLLLTGQTFIRRFIRNAGTRFVSKKKITRIIKNDLYNDINVDSLTRQIAVKGPIPKFVYTHFNRPHHPYFFDSTGNEIPAGLLGNTTDKKAYTGYLQYTNKKLLELVDHIKTNSTHPPVIMVMADHGFRQLPDQVDRKYHFMNLNAVYFPSGNYSGFYDGMSNVNQFRVTLNTLFRQNLPLLKDSTSFLIE